MDITTVFGTVVPGSSPGGSTERTIVSEVLPSTPGRCAARTRRCCEHSPEGESATCTDPVRIESVIAFLAGAHLNTKEAAYAASFVFTLSVRIGRIELPTRPWQGRVLPLNHIRFGRHHSILPVLFSTVLQKIGLRHSVQNRG